MGGNGVHPLKKTLKQLVRNPVIVKDSGAKVD